MEYRVIRLEETIAMQDRLIEQLSDALAAQQAEIDEMKRKLTLLGERVKGVMDSGGRADSEPDDEPPPPHYL